MSTPLTQEQIDYNKQRTNERGAAFTHPYFFMSTQLAGANNEYLNIVVQVVATGLIKGGNVKAHNGVLDGTVSDAFKRLVDDVLTKAEIRL